MISRHLYLCFILLAACSPTASKPPASASTSAPTSAPTSPPGPALECGPAIAGSDELLRAGGLVAIGEIHGTREVPAFVGDLACQAASRKLPVRVGLEIPRDEAPAIARFLASRGEPADRAALTAGPHWTRKDQDGRSSEATVALLDVLRRLRASHDVDAFVFDAEPTGAWNQRDAAMASEIVARATAEPDALVLTLSGNLHTRSVVGLPWDAAAVPMGVTLRQRRPDLRALDLRHTGGSAWICAPECGATTLKGGPAGAGRRVTLAAPDEFGHDGTYAVGSISAAPPAVPGA